jgi:DNA polymerase-3 subunit epsilon
MASQKIHGIDDRMVKDAPPWPVIGDLVAGIVHGKHIVAYNAGFDVHMIVTLFQRYKMEIPEFEVSCAMEEYSKFVGDWSKQKNDYKWQKLPKLAYGQAHDSLVDCQSTLLLMKKMAGDNTSDPTPTDIELDF